MDTERSMSRHLLRSRDVSHLWGMKLITKLAMVCILCTLLVCGSVSADDGNTLSPCIRIELEGDIGLCQDLQLNGVWLDQFFYLDDTWFYNDLSWRGKEDLSYHGGTVTKNIYINNPRVDREGHGFKEVKLILTLKRQWGFCGMFERFDLFQLYVTDLITKEDDKYIVHLKIKHSYECFKADSVTICDCNKNELRHFGSTHDDGWHY